MAECWRVGRHVPHHVYRGDGGLVADEAAVVQLRERGHGETCVWAALRDAVRRGEQE